MLSTEINPIMKWNAPGLFSTSSPLFPLDAPSLSAHATCGIPRSRTSITIHSSDLENHLFPGATPPLPHCVTWWTLYRRVDTNITTWTALTDPTSSQAPCHILPSPQSPTQHPSPARTNPIPSTVSTCYPLRNPYSSQHSATTTVFTPTSFPLH